MRFRCKPRWYTHLNLIFLSKIFETVIETRYENSIEYACKCESIVFSINDVDDARDFFFFFLSRVRYKCASGAYVVHFVSGCVFCSRCTAYFYVRTRNIVCSSCIRSCSSEILCTLDTEKTIDYCFQIEPVAVVVYPCISCRRYEFIAS